MKSFFFLLIVMSSYIYEDGLIKNMKFERTEMSTDFCVFCLRNQSSEIDISKIKFFETSNLNLADDYVIEVGQAKGLFFLFLRNLNERDCGIYRDLIDRTFSKEVPNYIVTPKGNVVIEKEKKIWTASFYEENKRDRTKKSPYVRVIYLK